MTRRLRIVHLIDLARVGGVETMYADLLAHAAPAGYDVEHVTLLDVPAIAPRFDAVVRKAGRVLSSKMLCGVSLPRRPRSIRAWNRLRQLRALAPDVIVAWNQFTEFEWPAWALPCPLVYYEHGMSWYDHHPRQLAGFFPRVDAAIAVSAAARRMLQLKHGVTFPVELIRNPLRPGFSACAVQPRTLPANRPFRLGAAGRLVPLKALGLLVLLVAALRRRGLDVEGDLAGDGPERAAIEALILREGLSGKVRLHGLVEDMPAFYAGLDAFVMTSMHETMPLVCIEAMSAGLPVFASRVDGFPELVADGVNGRCLQPTLSPERYQALTGASIAFARQVYDPETDALVPTALLDPVVLADAVAAMLSGDGSYEKASQAALAAAGAVTAYPDFLAAFYGCLARFSRR